MRCTSSRTLPFVVAARSKLQIASRSRRRKKWMERWKVVRATDASACLTAVYTRNRYAPRFHALACAASAQLSFYSTLLSPHRAAKRQPCTPCISILFLCLSRLFCSEVSSSFTFTYFPSTATGTTPRRATRRLIDSIPAFDDGREREHADLARNASHLALLVTHSFAYL